MTIIYPAIFHKEAGGYWVEFPDFPGCYTQGTTLEETMSNARESLAGYCVTLLEEKSQLVEPTHISSIQLSEDSFASPVVTELARR